DGLVGRRVLGGNGLEVRCTGGASVRWTSSPSCWRGTTDWKSVVRLVSILQRSMGRECSVRRPTQGYDRLPFVALADFAALLVLADLVATALLVALPPALEGFAFLLALPLLGASLFALLFATLFALLLASLLAFPFAPLLTGVAGAPKAREKLLPYF
ncbi:MAG: hypothetical protein ACKOBW_10615, partial [Planctomycetota bacterium]